MQKIWTRFELYHNLLNYSMYHEIELKVVLKLNYTEYNTMQQMNSKWINTV